MSGPGPISGVSHDSNMWMEANISLPKPGPQIW